MLVQCKGFSLIEISLVLAIMCLLAGLSMTVYTQHVVKTRRLAAEAALMRIAIALESGEMTVEEVPGYKIEMEKRQDGYLVQAFPDQYDECGMLSLDDKGKKEFSGTGRRDECW